MEVLIIIIILALFGSAFISASEASIIAVNRVRIRNLSDQGNKKAEAIEKTLEENEKFFGTLLLFGNLLNVLIATLVGTLIINLVGKGSVTSVIIATAISTIIVVTFGELTPKSISTRIADKWSLLVIKIIRGSKSPDDAKKSLLALKWKINKSKKILDLKELNISKDFISNLYHCL